LLQHSDARSVDQVERFFSPLITTCGELPIAIQTPNSPPLALGESHTHTESYQLWIEEGPVKARVDR
jgi:hypothetical protein